jgi:hypothetical protein
MKSQPCKIPVLSREQGSWQFLAWLFLNREERWHVPEECHMILIWLYNSISQKIDHHYERLKSYIRKDMRMHF